MVNLIRRQNTKPLARLRDEFEELVERFLSRWPAPFDTEYGLQRFWGLDVEDRDDETVVRAEVPGFEADELDVQFDGRLLTIKAEKKTCDGDSDERTCRSFRRSLRLPEGIDKERIKAEYRNGVLEVHLPKSEGAKPRHIPVRA